MENEKTVKGKEVETITHEKGSTPPVSVVQEIELFLTPTRDAEGNIVRQWQNTDEITPTPNLLESQKTKQVGIAKSKNKSKSMQKHEIFAKTPE